MLCPSCKNTDICVIDSRDTDDKTIRRRRECCLCSYRFTTYEKLTSIKLKVSKKDKSLQIYNREKIYNGLLLATEKLNLDSDKINDIVNNVERKIIKAKKDPIPTTLIGKIVLEELKSIDKVAYLRFTSVYKGFSSIKSFEKELKKLEKKDTK